jgi:superfamily II DNA or RNA helicase
MDINQIINECNSWDDFQIKLISLNKKEKGNAFELLTKLYFKINPVYSFYDEVWLLNEVPQQTLELLNIPSHDLGIDLIAKSGNEYHAIQCKFHTDIDSSVSFKEVATFISLLEGNKIFTQGYICSSANLTSRNLEKIETKPIATLLADTWQSLDLDFFDKARKFLNKEKYTPIPFQPKEHQVKAINQVVDYFEKENNTRGKLIFPCGAGKSLTGYWLTQKLNSKATLIAVPSLSLVKQTLDVYLREIVAEGKKVKWLCICSDEGIGTDQEIVFKTENLGVPCQTDSSFIKNWLEENQQEEIVVFTTYQSGRIISEVANTLNFSFDVGIFDEAHKTVGSSKKLFSYLLFEENIAIKKRIFMTATERFYAGSKDEIISMDDEEIYGDIFAQMSFKDAINLGLLTDYKVVTIDVTKNEIADFIKENNLVQLNDKWKKETEARSLASMLALRKAMKLFPIKNAVSFHSSIEKATRNKELQNYITETYNYSPIDTYTVSGKMPTTKRNVVINEFANSPKSLITNARCLTEGVDVPNIDCIVFSDPRKSKVDIVQALGRALRKKEGKDWGYVILPVVYDETTNEIDNENFNEILAVVRGLASNDERIIEYFKDKKEGLATKRTDKTEQLQFEVFSDYVDANQLASELQVKLWEKLSRFQWMPFEEARECVRRLGLKSNREWIEYTKSVLFNNDLPKFPNQVYKYSGWVSWGDFLGNKNIASHLVQYRNFSDAREFVRSLGLKNSMQWREFCMSDEFPIDLPRKPDQTYKDKGWSGMYDWLGRKEGARYNSDKVLLKYEEAKKIIHNQQIKNWKEWQEYKKLENFPSNIPKNPEIYYQFNGWKNWSDWLGNNNISTSQKSFLSFQESKIEVQKLGIKSIVEWRELCNSKLKPDFLPVNPYKVYKDQWKGWGDWLGTGRISNQNKSFLSFDEAKKYVCKLGLRNEKEWRVWKRDGKLPANIPAKPEVVYKDKGWKSYRDFLGKEDN